MADPRRRSRLVSWLPSLYPLALPVAYVVVVWADSFIHPIWLVRPLVVALVAGLVALVLAAALVRNQHLASLIAFLALLGLVVDSLAFAAAMLAFAAGLTVVGVARRGGTWRLGPTVTRGLAGLSAILLVLTGVTVVTNGSGASAVDDVAADLAHAGPRAGADRDRPDIWVILLDGYPGDDAAALLSPDGFDPEALPAALTSRGFEVQRHSRTNYPLTRLVLPAMLTATHIGDLGLHPNPPAERSLDAAELRKAGDDGEVLRAAGAAGYERIAISSGWAHIGLRRVDEVIDAPGLDEFELGLLRVSGLGHLLDLVAPRVVGDSHRARVDATFELAGDLASRPSDAPRLVFVHVPSPHPPLVFGTDGSARHGGPATRLGELDNQGGLDRAARIARTFEQVAYVGRRALELVDRIRDASSRPPVIVLFSDHGTDVGWNDVRPLDADLDERMSNLLAVSAPGHPGLFPPGTTPVNVFPYVLNAYLGTALPIRPDTMWVWRSGASALDLVQVDRASLGAATTRSGAP